MEAQVEGDGADGRGVAQAEAGGAPKIGGGDGFGRLEPEVAGVEEEASHEVPVEGKAKLRSRKHVEIASLERNGAARVEKARLLSATAAEEQGAAVGQLLAERGAPILRHQRVFGPAAHGAGTAELEALGRDGDGILLQVEDLAPASGEYEHRAAPDGYGADERAGYLDEIHLGAAAQVLRKIRVESSGDPLARIGHVVAQVEKEPRPDGAEQDLPLRKAQVLKVTRGEGPVERVEAARFFDVVGLDLEAQGRR